MKDPISGHDRSPFAASMNVLIIASMLLAALPSLSVVGEEGMSLSGVEYDDAIPSGVWGKTTDSPEMFIHLQAASFDPLLFEPEFSSELMSKGNGGPMMVQFTGPIFEDWKEELVGMGVVLGSYVPDFTFTALMDEGVKEDVSSLPYVRWIGDHHPAYRIEPRLLEEISKRAPDDALKVSVALSPWADVPEFSSYLKKIGAMVVDDSSFIVHAKVPMGRMIQLSHHPDVEFIMETLDDFHVNNDIAAGIMDAPKVWNTHGLNGSGQVVGVSDSGLDTGVDNWGTDGDILPDFDNRATIFNWYGSSADDANGHGTHVSGSVLGAGASSGGQFKGTAYGATLVFQGLGDNAGSTSVYPPNNLGNLFSQAYNNGARVHTNSWGSSSNPGTYDTMSWHVDNFIWNQENMTILYSAGNDGSGSDTIGNPGTAKNAITVGATENYRPSKGSLANNIDEVGGFSSRGPCDDGRIKPDIVGPGTYIISSMSSVANGLPNPLGWGAYDSFHCYSTGTSMSTPLVAGLATVTRQYYEVNNSHDASAALVKATLINGATDLPGYGSVPNNVEGWGRVNISHSLFPLAPATSEFVDNKTGVSTGETFVYQFAIANTTVPLSVTLVWSDYYGTTSASVHLVNDLDLNVTSPTGTVYNGNDMTSPYNDTFDHTNNVEGVRIGSTESGMYTVSVKGFNVPQGGSQPFALHIIGGISPSVGSISFNKQIYETVEPVQITLIDQNETGSGTQQVSLSSPSDLGGESIDLQETPPGSGVFKGDIQLTQDAPGTGSLKVTKGDVITVTYIDNWPPGIRMSTALIVSSAPENLTVVSDPIGNKLVLTWDPTQRQTYTGYNLYRNKSSFADFDLIKSLSQVTTYTDVNLTDGVNYTYYITTRDLGFESGNSSQAWGIPSDITAPTVTITSPGNNTLLSGTVPLTYNTHDDVVNVLIEYYEDVNGNGLDDDGGTWEDLVNVVDVTGGYSWDTTTNPGQDITLLLRANATDEVPLWSGASPTIINLTIDNNAPAAPNLEPVINITSEPEIILRGNITSHLGEFEWDATVEVIRNATVIASNTSGAQGEFDIQVDLLEGFNNITLQATDRWGIGPGASTPVITVVLDTIEPVAQAGSDQMVSSGTEVVMNASASSDTVTASPQWNTIVNYTWSFSYGGSLVTLEGMGVSYTFGTIGDFQVTLEVSDRAGNKDTDTVSISTSDTMPPLADAGGDRTVDEDTMVRFTANASTDNDNTLLTTGRATWTIYDLQSPVEKGGMFMNHTFVTPGSYLVELNISDRSGNWDTDVITVQVRDITAPVARAGGDRIVVANEEIELDGSGSTDNDPLFPENATFTWVIDGDEELEGREVTHSFDSPGSYDVELLVEDAGGNVGKDELTVTVISDTVLPFVESTEPEDGDNDVPLDIVITATFSKPMDGKRFDKEGFKVEDEDGNEVLGDRSYDDGTDTVSFDPVGDLEPGVTYTVTLVSEEITDLSGLELDGDGDEETGGSPKDDFTWSFTTFAYPVIVERTPGRGEKSVDVNTDIMVVFSKSMDEDSFLDEFSLEDDAGKSVEGDMAIEGDSLTFSPSLPLQYHMTYTVIIGNGIMDTEGFNLQHGEDWRFTTEFEESEGDGGLLDTLSVEPGSRMCFILLAILIILIIAILVGSIMHGRSKREKQERAWDEMERGKEGEDREDVAYSDFRDREDEGAYAPVAYAGGRRGRAPSRRRPSGTGREGPSGRRRDVPPPPARGRTRKGGRKPREEGREGRDREVKEDRRGKKEEGKKRPKGRGKAAGIAVGGSAAGAAKRKGPSRPSMEEAQEIQWLDEGMDEDEEIDLDLKEDEFPEWEGDNGGEEDELAGDGEEMEFELDEDAEDAPDEDDFPEWDESEADSMDLDRELRGGVAAGGAGIGKKGKGPKKDILEDEEFKELLDIEEDGEEAEHIEEDMEEDIDGDDGEDEVEFEMDEEQEEEDVDDWDA